MDTSPKAATVDPSKILRGAVEKCKHELDELVPDWTTSVDYRRGHPFETDSDQDRVYVNVDAPMTRRKTTQLASQAPEVRLATDDPRAKPALDQFAKRLNKEIIKANVADGLWETSVDAVNAAGFGWVLCGFEARTEDRAVPIADPMTLSDDQLAALDAVQSGEIQPDQAKELYDVFGIATQMVPHVVSSRLYSRRGSPSDFLWDLSFENSNFDEASWIGHRGRMSWAEAKVAFKLSDEDKEKVCGDQIRENLRGSNDPNNRMTDEHLVARYDELFYWRAKFDPNEKYLDCIWRIVFVDGKEEPVIHRHWSEGQKFVEGVGYLGVKKLPIRVLTLDYFSDDPLPPSDSAIARPQVNEKIRSRTQMILQRERSLPARWHNTNLLDPLVAVNLQRGVYQASIPVKGNGNNAIGEVARASYPPENYEFDRTINRDIDESWMMGDNQRGMMSTGRRTRGEAEIAQSNFAIPAGFQRARVARFFTSIAEVFAGLLVLHGKDLPLPAADTENPMDVAELASAFEYSVLPDSTVLLDASQKADNLADLLDLTGKSGFVNPKPLIEDIFRFRGVDPTGVVIDPQPPKPEEPNISYRFGGIQDLNDPVVMAMLVGAGKAPTPENLAAAIQILQAAHGAVAAGLVPPPPVAESNPDGDPGPQRPGDNNPEWGTMTRVKKRSDSEK